METLLIYLLVGVFAGLIAGLIAGLFGVVAASALFAPLGRGWHTACRARPEAHVRGVSAPLGIYMFMSA